MLISRSPTPRLDACRAPLDSTTLDSTTSAHGLLPKLAGGTTLFLRADGAWANADSSGGEANTVANIGTAGVGLFKEKSGIELRFKTLNAGSSKVTLTDDTANNEVDVDVVEANLTLQNLGGTLTVAKGGTGATDASGARSSLGLAALAVLSTVGTSQIDNSAVTLAKLQNVATDILLGRATSGTGVVETVPCTAAGRALLAGNAASDQRTTLGLGSLAVLSSVGTSQLTANAVTFAKFQQIAVDNLIGRSTSGTGDVELIPCTVAGRALLAGAANSDQRTALGLGALAVLSTVGATQIDNAAVTYAKIQNVTQARLLGRYTASNGAPQEISLGSGLSLNSTTGELTATAGDPAPATFPIGMIIWSAQAETPADWLACNGAAVSRTSYAELFAAIGTTFGVGDGSTTFNVPDLRGRGMIGSGTGSGLTARTQGQSGGAETHVLSPTEMPSHSHDIQTLQAGAGGIQSGSGIGPTNTTTGSTGGGGAHNNMSPFLVINAFIYAGSAIEE